MIFIKSRYSSEVIQAIVFPNTKKTTMTVFRMPPKNLNNKKVKYYRWRQGDRIDQVAYTVFEDPELWWKIMDANPEITDPNNISPGDVIRIPQ
jgi:nucleoid-associated protein YgaU